MLVIGRDDSGGTLRPKSDQKIRTLSQQSSLDGIIEKHFTYSEFTRVAMI